MVRLGPLPEGRNVFFLRALPSPTQSGSLHTVLQVRSLVVFPLFPPVSLIFFLHCLSPEVS